MDKEKFNIVINSFDDVGIKIPTEVYNSIEDVFLENDSIDEVIVYDISEIDIIQEKLTITNKANMYVDGRHEGEKTNVYTYYGDISFSLSEYVNLCEPDGNVIEEIVHFDDEGGSIIEVPKKWNVILLETITWDSNEKDGPVKQKLTLYIYCPELLGDEPENELAIGDQYDAVYGNEGNE